MKYLLSTVIFCLALSPLFADFRTIDQTYFSISVSDNWRNTQSGKFYLVSTDNKAQFRFIILDKKTGMAELKNSFDRVTTAWKWKWYKMDDSIINASQAQNGLLADAVEIRKYSSGGSMKVYHKLFIFESVRYYYVILSDFQDSVNREVLNDISQMVKSLQVKDIPEPQLEYDDSIINDPDLFTK